MASPDLTRGGRRGEREQMLEYLQEHRLGVSRRWISRTDMTHSMSRNSRLAMRSGILLCG